MKIGVVSDSHGDRKSLQQAIDVMGKVDVIFHLGDYVKDGEEIRRICPNIPVYTLRGNMDYGLPDGEDYVKTIIGGKTIIACHGHAYGVKSGVNVYFYQAKSEKADIALFGHTHCAFLEEAEGILIMNPGALSRTWGVEKSFGILTIEDDAVHGEIIPLKTSSSGKD